jgi:hypothetical protein
MIANEVQYRATKAHLAKFEEAIANLEAAGATQPVQSSVPLKSTPCGPRPRTSKLRLVSMSNSERER